MVNIDLIYKRGGDPKELKKKFDAGNVKPGGKIEELIKLTAGRVNDGLQGNFRDSRMWWAIDRAYDVNQRQVPYTLVSGFLDSKPSKTSDIYRAAKDWGIDNLLTPLCNSDGTARCVPGTGDPIMKLDLPTFFQIYVPMVQAYHKIRVAKLFGDRDRTPLYPYEPLRNTMRDRLKTDIITARVQRMATDMGYRADERQSIHQCVLYGTCLNFPMEDWWTDKQLDHDGKEKILREGIRNAIPHPSRQFYDLGHRLSTLNSDTGVQWCGYWDITRWGEVQSNEHFWNTDVVEATYGKYNWLKSDGWRIYQELFPCRFPFPNLSERQGAGEQDRVERANYYLTDDYDRGVTLVSIFQKLNPKEWGLYDYDYPVWHRFVLAAEQSVLWVSPLGYTPAPAYLYDHDQGRAFNSSLGLELLPWQDLMSNYLTQLLISVKQNLANVVFWNKDLLDDKYVELIENLGEKMYRKTNYIPFSMQEWSWQKQAAQEVFHKVDMPKHNTQEVLQAINTMIQIMERMLGYTPEEVGGRSTSDESATAANIRESHRGIRISFTGSFIDEARHARKRQLYDAMMNYSDDEIFAEVADLNDAKKEELEKMGFKVEYPDKGEYTQAGIKGSKSKLTLDGFATERDMSMQAPDQQIAAAMIQTFQAMFANPQMVEQIGVPQLIDLFNQMLFYAGMPKDFRLKLDSAKKSPMAQQSEQITQLQEQLAQALGQVKAEAASDAKIVQETQTGMQQLAEGVKAGMQGMAQQTQESMEGLASATKDEMQKMAVGIQQGVVAPMNQKIQSMGQALIQLLQQVETNDQKDLMQDETIQKMIAIFTAAATEPAPLMPQPNLISVPEPQPPVLGLA